MENINKIQANDLSPEGKRRLTVSAFAAGRTEPYSALVGSVQEPTTETEEERTQGVGFRPGYTPSAKMQDTLNAMYASGKQLLPHKRLGPLSSRIRSRR